MGVWITVDDAELASLTAEIDAAAADLDEVCHRLRSAQVRVAALAAAAESALPSYQHLADSLTSSAIAADRARTCVSSRAASLRGALREYDGAEKVPAVLDALAGIPGVPGWGLAWAAAGLVGIESAASPHGLRMGGLWTALMVNGTGVAGVGGWLARNASPRLGSNPVGDAGAVLDPLGTVLGAPPSPYTGPFGAPGLAGLAGAAGLVGLPSLLGGAMRRLDAVIDVGPPMRGSTSAAAGVGDLAARIGLAYDDVPEGAGAVDVQRIEHADGSVSWTVSVPGTQGFGAASGASTVPMAGDVNVAAYLGLPGPPDALVLAAMDQAGIPPGEPVVLAGHSLAGMVVMRLAATPAVTERYRVAGVVTLGSPVGHLRGAPVPALHVRHAEDGTPSLSGVSGSRPGGPAPGEVVVVKELGPEASSMSTAHAIETYEDTAREVAASGHPGLAAWEEATKHVWARQGDTVTSSLHTGRVR